MAKLSVSLACAAYDRTWPLISGRVPIEGCNVNFVVLEPGEAFVRAYRSQDFDITELSASSHILTTARGDAPYIAVPAFVSRVFRHSSFYIRTDRGIRSASDLRGKTVGVTEYQMTAGLWARGLLSDDFGVRANEIRWRRGGLDAPGGAERTAIKLSADIDLQSIGDGKTLSGMLLDGDLDAIIAAHAPAPFLQGAANIGRLWPDFRAAEEDYFKRTGLFPIMHLIGIRRSLVERHPWLAPSVLKAFTRAKQIALEELEDVGVSRASLPWLPSDVARAKQIMGPDFWPYGYPANERAIDCMLRWSVEQGLSQRLVKPEELFAPGTLQDL
ncbi:MAG TPA: PhnD/SsuA/transferrin family substrate-binding protein [Xanthobacteraceae bacterium]|nr:PhnD/SsuA/transferrin family substrate-binding protein [Xanthobacteraceae bacterium]